MEKVNLSEKLALFSEQGKPKVGGELNGQQVKLVKFEGPFVWHHHDHEDELFLVVKGRFRMEVFMIDPGSGERLGLLATATVGEAGWVDLQEPIIVRAGEGFIAVPE